MATISGAVRLLFAQLNYERSRFVELIPSVTEIAKKMIFVKRGHCLGDYSY